MEYRVFRYGEFIGEVTFSLEPQGKKVQGSGVQHLELDKSYELIVRNRVFEYGEFISDEILGSGPLG